MDTRHLRDFTIFLASTKMNDPQGLHATVFLESGAPFPGVCSFANKALVKEAGAKFLDPGSHHTIVALSLIHI